MRTKARLGLLLGLGTAAVVVALAACSSDNNKANADSGDSGTGAGDAGSTAVATPDAQNTQSTNDGGTSTTPDGSAKTLTCEQNIGTPVGTWTSSAISLPLASLLGARTAVWSGTEVVFVGWDKSDRKVVAYNPSTKAWRDIAIGAGAPSARDFPLIGIAQGKLIVYGGATDIYSGGALDLATGSWTALPSLNAPELFASTEPVPHVFEASDGRVLFFADGALRAPNPPPAVGVLDPSLSTWSSVFESITGLTYGCDKLARAGDLFACGNALDVHGVRLAPDAGVELVRLSQPWTGTTGAISVAMVGTRAVFYRGETGGQNRDMHTVDLENLDGGFKTNATRVPRRTNSFTVTLGDRVVTWGGSAGGSPRSDGTVYDPTTDTWQSMSCTGAPESNFARALTSNGSKLFLIDGTPSPKLYEYSL